MSLFQLVYFSRAADTFAAEHLAQIRETAERRNPAAGITGILVYSRGHYLQLLEGNRDALADLYERIRDDDRHTGCDLLSLGPADHRLFPAWSMGVLDLDEGHCPEELAILWDHVIEPLRAGPEDERPLAIATLVTYLSKLGGQAPEQAPEQGDEQAA